MFEDIDWEEYDIEQVLEYLKVSKLSECHNFVDDIGFFIRESERIKLAANRNNNRDIWYTWLAYTMRQNDKNVHLVRHMNNMERDG